MRNSVKKMLGIGLTMVLAVTALAGCGGNSGNKTTKGESSQSSVSDSSTAAEGKTSGADKSKSLLIYTNSGSDGRQEWLVDRAKQEGFRIEILPLGGGDILNRLLAEKNNIQADLVFGMSAIDYEKLKAENLLMKYEPVWKEEVDMSTGDADGYYYPIVIQPLVMMYQADMADPPKDILDLCDSKYKDKFNVGALGGATPRNLYASILVRYQDPNGEFGISEEGWAKAKAYLQNAHITIEGEDYIGNVIDGKRPITAMWGSGVIQNQNERDYKFGIVCPELGVPYIAEQVAILNKEDKSDLAKEFIDWFGSEKIQSEWSAEFGTIPANKTSITKISDDAKAFMEQVHSQDMDWAFVAENIDNWVEKAELEFLN